MHVRDGLTYSDVHLQTPLSNKTFISYHRDT